MCKRCSVCDLPLDGEERLEHLSPPIQNVVDDQHNDTTASAAIQGHMATWRHAADLYHKAEMAMEWESGDDYPEVDHV